MINAATGKTGRLRKMAAIELRGRVRRLANGENIGTENKTYRNARTTILRKSLLVVLILLYHTQ